jgi:hypothetical protein
MIGTRQSNPESGKQFDGKILEKDQEFSFPGS